MNDSNGLHIAQLGAGYWGPNLIRNFNQIGGIRAFTACDLDRKRLDKMQGLYPSINTTSSADEIFGNPDVDAVVIALPACMHFEFGMRALESGKHVFIEKPLATTRAEAEKLTRLAEEKGLIVMAGHTFLYNSVVHKVKEIVDSGELGEIYYVISQRLNLGRVRQDVNALWTLAPHDISMVLHLFEEEPSAISAKGLTFLQDNIPDVVFMDMDFPSGRAAHIHVSWLDPNKTRKMFIVGSKKMLAYDDVSPDAKITIYDKGVDKLSIIRDLPDIDSFGQFQFLHRQGDILIPKVEFKEPLRAVCTAFVDAINTGVPPLADGRNGTLVVDALERAQKSLDSGTGKQF